MTSRDPIASLDDYIEIEYASSSEDDTGFLQWDFTFLFPERARLAIPAGFSISSCFLIPSVVTMTAGTGLLFFARFFFYLLLFILSIFLPFFPTFQFISCPFTTRFNVHGLHFRWKWDFGPMDVVKWSPVPRRAHSVFATWKSKEQNQQQPEKKITKNNNNLFLSIDLFIIQLLL